MSTKPGGHDGVAAWSKLPLLHPGESCADVCGEGSVDGHACHSVTWVPEPLKPRRGLSVPLKAGRVASLHVDADDVPRVVALGIPESTMTVLYAGILHLFQEVR